jgi:hypothetical protein
MAKLIAFDSPSLKPQNPKTPKPHFVWRNGIDNSNKV